MWKSERATQAEGTAWAKALRCGTRQAMRVNEGSRATDKPDKAVKARSRSLYLSLVQG